MRIGVDGYPLAAPLTGVGRYLRDLLRAMINVDPTLAIVAPRFRRRSITPIRLSEPAITQRWPSSVNSLYRILDRLGTTLPFDVLTGKVQAQLFTTYTTFPTRKPSATFIYDLTALHFRDTLHPALRRRLLSRIESSVRTSNAILTISETVASELRGQYPGTQVDVILPGPTTDLPVDPPDDWAERLRRLNVVPGYVLFVGTMEPRKNLGLLLDALDIDPHLNGVLVGARGWEGSELRHRAAHHPRVTTLGFVSDLDLRSLYEGAAALIMPSLYEGFGLPIIEAMTCGTPVVCSRIPVFTEVAAEAALYFETDDPHEVVRSLERAQTEHRTMSELGRARVSEFSWERSARKTIAVLDRIIRQ